MTARSIAFWQMSTLSSSVGRDVDRRVRDDEHLVVRRHVHQEHVADPPAGAQAVSRATTAPSSSSVCRLPFIRSSASPFAHERHGARCGSMAVRRIDDARLAETDPDLFGDLLDLARPDPTRMGVIRSQGPGFHRAARAADCSHGCATAVGDRVQVAAALQELARISPYRFHVVMVPRAVAQVGPAARSAGPDPVSALC